MLYAILLVRKESSHLPHRAVLAVNRCIAQEKGTQKQLPSSQRFWPRLPQPLVPPYRLEEVSSWGESNRARLRFFKCLPISGTTSTLCQRRYPLNWVRRVSTVGK